MRSSQFKTLALTFTGLFICIQISAQFRFSGQVSDATADTQVYLSLVEDYRKINRVYVDQIIRRTVTDSLGNFEFQGNFLPNQNRIYRIHTDACGEISVADHFLGSCDDIRSVLFIANNKDTLHLPATFDSEIFCDIVSTNPKSGIFLELNELKEEMVLDFAQFDSEANRSLSMNKWFFKLQEFGESSNEPLAELYIYELLSDKRNPTYNHYLKEVVSNPYYDELLTRLEDQYPEASFTQLYSAEIRTDIELASLKNPSASRVSLLIYIVLAVSVLLNILLYRRWKRTREKRHVALKKLTRQEQKIVDNILLGMSNKQIADELFVSVSTVKTHINNLYKKLNITDRDDIKTLFGK